MVKKKNKLKKKRSKRSKRTIPESSFWHMEVCPFMENLYWSFAPTFDKFAAQFEKSLPKLIEQGIVASERGMDQIGSRGVFQVYMGENCIAPIVWIKAEGGESDVDLMTTLSHEVFHFVHWLLNRKGVHLSDETDEVYAYLLEFLIETIMANKPDRLKEMPTP